METIVRIEGNIQWTTFRDPSSGMWIAESESLGLTLEAETYTELVTTIGEGVDLLMHDLAKSGELESFLKEHNWVATTPLPQHAKSVKFDIPWYLLAGSPGHDRNKTAH